MNKEEILERSREEKRDEGKEFVVHKGRKTGVLAMLILFIVLAAFSLYNNHHETTYALITVFFGYLGSESYGIYALTGTKIDLLKTVTGWMVCIVFLVLYVNGVTQ